MTISEEKVRNLRQLQKIKIASIDLPVDQNAGEIKYLVAELSELATTVVLPKRIVNPHILSELSARCKEVLKAIQNNHTIDTYLLRSAIDNLQKAIAGGDYSPYVQDMWYK